MTFGAVFSRAMRPPFGPNTGGGGGAWWNLFGAIPLANCVAAYQPKGAANLAASYINLTGNATYNCAPVEVAPAWDVASGWKFTIAAIPNRTSLTTGVTAGSNYSAVVRFSNSTDTSANQAVFGNVTTNANFFLLLRTTPKHRHANGVNLVTTASAWPASGVFGLTPGAGYRDGLSDGTFVYSWTGTAVPMFIGCYSNAGSVTAPFTGYIQAFAVYNSDQAANMAALYIAMAAL